MITVINPPNQLPFDKINGVIPNSIFLAGTIEMGNSIDWQTETIKLIENHPLSHYTNFTILNPRRTDWDSSWKQDIKNKQFKEQVSWELTSLDSVETIFMYLDPQSKSPISLLELGLYASSGKLIVCCPDGFWRKGNVDIVCERYKIKTFNSIEKVVNYYINNVLKNETC